MAKQGWFTRATTSLVNWLVVGADPKVRDPENSSRQAGSSAGVPVNDAAAMRISAFWACARLIASSGASLPFPAYWVDDNGVRKTARDAPIYRVLHDRPNADQSPVDFWEFGLLALMLRGDMYARKLIEGGRLVGLEPVNPALVTKRRLPSGQIGYRWSFDGASYDLTEDDVFHVRGFGGGPMGGLSIVANARESLGLAIAADKAAGSVFANGIHPSGVLQSDFEFNKDQQKEVEDRLDEKYMGAHRTGRPMVLGYGLKWSSIAMKADDAQLIQSRAWSVEDICRWFGVPPFMIGHNEKTTSWGTGIEQMTLGFLKFTLNPYLRRIEQAVRAQLLTPAERARGLTAEFNIEGLLRADSQGRARFYDSALKSRWMVVNEVRRLENMAPVAWGDEPIVQAQDIPLSERLDELRREIDNAA